MSDANINPIAFMTVTLMNGEQYNTQFIAFGENTISFIPTGEKKYFYFNCSEVGRIEPISK